MFTKTFFRFLFGFAAIMAVAFGVFIVGAQFEPTTATAVAVP